MQKIYLDNAASTTIDEDVLDETVKLLKNSYANSAAAHGFGQEASRHLEWARKATADFLNCQPMEIIFNSGATEGNNTVINSARYFQHQNGKKPHIITTLIEHPSAADPCRELEKLGLAEVSWVKPDKNGVIEPKKIISKIKETTALISVTYVNHETGAIQPIREIGKAIEKLKSQSPTSDYPIFHTDITQAIGWINCDIQYLHCHSAVFSGHKIHSLKGIGALYVKNGVKIHPLIFGGGQEFGKRPGTINHIGVFTLGRAIGKLSKNYWQWSQKTALLKKYLEAEMKKINSKIIIPSENVACASHIASFIFPGVNNQSLLVALDQKGVAVSIGSACLSGSFEPSKTLMAMGYSEERARSNIRVSLSKNTTKDEIKRFIKIFKQIYETFKR